VQSVAAHHRAVFLCTVPICVVMVGKWPEMVLLEGCGWVYSYMTSSGPLAIKQSLSYHGGLVGRHVGREPKSDPHGGVCPRTRNYQHICCWERECHVASSSSALGHVVFLVHCLLSALLYPRRKCNLADQGHRKR
jgi:hypothetical protein